jgi:zinc protease
MSRAGRILARTASCPKTVLLCAIVALAAAPPAAAYHEEVLPNGLRVVLVENRANPMVCSSAIVGAGVVDEPDGMNGATHFLEHLVFNGTETRSQRALYDEVDRFGAYNNATTREDHTLFTLLLQKEFAAKGLEIQADMLFHSTLPPDKFEKEKGIILEELAKDRNDPAYLAQDAFRGFAYAGTPLARPVLGSESSIKGMSRDRVLAYYKARYVPG